MSGPGGSRGTASARLGPVMVELSASGPGSPLALEALEVVLGPVEAKQVLPLLQPGLPAAERLNQLPHRRVKVRRISWDGCRIW